MQKIKWLAVIAIAAAVYALALGIYEPETDAAIVTKVVDGDTIVIEGGQRVRLLNIDTRERGESCYREAKDRLEELVLLKEVVLERKGNDKDRYGRLLRHIFLDSQHVNLLLVQEGLANAYIYDDKAGYVSEFREAEQLAKEEGGCVWTQMP